MFMRIAIACFALYCVHGAQNTARDGAVLAEKGASLAREATSNAPRAALAFCLDNASLCAKASGVAAPEEASKPTPAKAAALQPVDQYPLPPRRPASHKRS